MVALKLNPEKLLFGVLVASAGVSSAIVINAILQYKAFTLPSVKTEAKSYYHLKPKNNSYRFLDYLFARPASNTGKETTPSTATSISGIKLVGIFSSDKEKIAFFKSGNDFLFLKEGQKIAGYTLKEIGKFSVVLEKNGRKIKLSIEPEKSNFSTTHVAKLRKTPQDSQPKDLPIRYNGDTIQVDKRFIEEKTADIGTILKDVMIVPVVKNNETVGYRFKYIGPNSILYKLGLRSGDLVVSINDMPVKTAEDAFKLYNMLRNESHIKVVVERNNRRKVLNYEIR
ncbi:PDZ domain-containing protein [Persephonella sp. KM09-Lau-8]|uniref:PDZ domain-containing protein n=1 Tax=Persephonella sp. KM09-Lau-8 TaxID=1158345 RepID=UPI000495F92E|nr:PDZ domain-containing protein [Persephonella sp. KM09-Lau-8]